MSAASASQALDLPAQMLTSQSALKCDRWPGPPMNREIALVISSRRQKFTVIDMTLSIPEVYERRQYWNPSARFCQESALALIHFSALNETAVSDRLCLQEIANTQSLRSPADVSERVPPRGKCSRCNH